MTRGPKKKFDREEVLEKAMQLFWRQGYEATGMSELLTEMGIGRQSLYDTFGDKRSLYLEALRHYFEGRIALAREILGRRGSPLGNLRAMFEAFLEITAESGFCGCFVGNTMAEFGHRDPEVEEITSAFLERYRLALLGVLERAQEAGELPPQVSPGDLAQMLVVTSQGLALLSKIKPEESLEMAGSVLRTSFAMLERSA